MESMLPDSPAEVKDERRESDGERSIWGRKGRDREMVVGVSWK